MKKTGSKRLRSYVRWTLWVLLVQLILANISAAIYAYRFTHFYEGQPPQNSSDNLFTKTWKLFTGPKYYKQAKVGEPGFPYETVNMRTADEILLNGWYSTVDSARGCVVFFHGMMVNKGFVKDEAARFRQWGYNVLLIDFRGHGQSEGHTTSFGVEESEDVRTAFEFAKERGNEKIILYGVSLGAAAALRAVSEQNLAVQGIIADMPFDNLHDHFKARASQVGFPTQPFAFLVTLWTGLESGYNGFNHRVSRYCRNIKCPVLVQWGEKDQLVSRADIDHVFENIASGRKKLATYETADHESLLRADARLWEHEVTAFLDGLPAEKLTF